MYTGIGPGRGDNTREIRPIGNCALGQRTDCIYAHDESRALGRGGNHGARAVVGAGLQQAQVHLSPLNFGMRSIGTLGPKAVLVHAPLGWKRWCSANEKAIRFLSEYYSDIYAARGLSNV